MIGAAGIEREVTPPLNDEDQEALRKSAKALRSVIEAMQEAE